MKVLCRVLVPALLIGCLGSIARASETHQEAPPNFIVIFADDQGYNDLGCFGSDHIQTPNIDRLASEGRRFTSFYVPCSVCSPSRAALMTGCYPIRISMEKHVIFPQQHHGLHPDEVTIADMLKTRGYATACVGKWHLGHRPPLLPTRQGFDSYYGIPYSNDMNHPDNKGKPRISMDATWLNQDQALANWNTPLMQDEEIIELPVNQRTITRRYTDQAIQFVQANKDRPFFLYLPHSMPHIPLFVPKDAWDPDPQNAYKAVIEHIDTEVGRLINTVRELDLSSNTYIIYTSDNGPWLQFKNHGGSAKPLRAGKGTTYEGGQRVPCVMWGPGRIPAGTTTDAITSTMDLIPTIARLADAELQPRGAIDGFDISEVLHGSDQSPRDELVFYSSNGVLHGIRKGDWKLRITPIRRKKSAGQKEPDRVATHPPASNELVELYRLSEDIGESNNLADSMPEKVEQLRKLMLARDQELTANKRSRGNFPPAAAPSKASSP